MDANSESSSCTCRACEKLASALALPEGSKFTLTRDGIRSLLRDSAEVATLDDVGKPPEISRPYSVSDFADICGKAPSTVRGWLGRGLIPSAFKKRNQWVIPRKAAENYLNAPAENDLQQRRAESQASAELSRWREFVTDAA